MYAAGLQLHRVAKGGRGITYQSRYAAAPDQILSDAPEELPEDVPATVFPVWPPIPEERWKAGKFINTYDDHVDEDDD